jgi:hypothetical protein
MRLDELVQVSLLLRDELFELRPLTSDDFEVAVVLDLADEKDHLGKGDASLMEVEGDGCRTERSVWESVMNEKRTERNPA